MQADCRGKPPSSGRDGCSRFGITQVARRTCLQETIPGTPESNSTSTEMFMCRGLAKGGLARVASCPNRFGRIARGSGHVRLRVVWAATKPGSGPNRRSGGGRKQSEDLGTGWRIQRRIRGKFNLGLWRHVSCEPERKRRNLDQRLVGVDHGHGCRGWHHGIQEREDAAGVAPSSIVPLWCVPCIGCFSLPWRCSDCVPNECSKDSADLFPRLH
jgi:hypothetical protein